MFPVYKPNFLAQPNFIFSCFQQCVSLITGGASGLGRATAERFARAGSKVIIMDLPSSDGVKVAEEIGPNCMFAPADVSVKSCLY